MKYNKKLFIYIIDFSRVLFPCEKQDVTQGMFNFDYKVILSPLSGH
jgi:hypothetical protein